MTDMPRHVGDELYVQRVGRWTWEAEARAIPTALGAGYGYLDGGISAARFSGWRARQRAEKWLRRLAAKEQLRRETYRVNP
jgi:hypothetical protein